MGTRYNPIAGENIERLAALSDGVFVAMTLLVLHLKVPAAAAVLGVVLFVSWRYARRAGLVEAAAAERLDRSVGRIVIAQALYALGSALTGASGLS